MTESRGRGIARVRIERARRSEAEPLAELASRTFREAFGNENTVSDMASYVEEAFSTGRVASELADSANTFLVARLEVGGPIIGYAKLKKGEADSSVSGPEPLELQRLYLDPSAIGTGAGSALMEECLATAEQVGCKTLWLGVWERNERAISFYRRWGFRELGEHVFLLGSDSQTDLIMARAVDLAVD